ncbi:MAG: hypothetical protein M3T56_19275, partial [Chloroflexota bacterium]|nr:hypothetical protein [Chloroflexota bacterium]
GILRVFRATTRPPQGLPRLAADAADAMLRAAGAEGGELDLLSADTARSFFLRYYQKVGNMDGLDITGKRRELKFRQVAASYRFIRDATVAVWVPFDDSARARLADLRRFGPTRPLLRSLQRYTVSVWPDALERLRRAGQVEDLGVDPENVLVALRETSDVYSKRFGLEVPRVGESDPSTFIV